MMLSHFSFGSYLKRLHTNAVHDPVRDWLALITFASIALVGIIVWNIWTFSTIASGGTISENPSPAPSSLLSSSSLDAIHALFDRRAGEAAKFENGIYHFSDPSQ